MNRAQFMEQLKRLLSDISETERDEALDYYESYFDDAGQENEAAVIRELGSPGKVAAIIKADLRESNDSYAQYTEWGYEDTRNTEPGQMPDKYTAVSARNKGDKNASENEREQGSTYERGSTEKSGSDEASQKQGYESNYSQSRRERGYHAEKKKNRTGVILVLILLVFLSPFIVGGVGSAFGILVGIALLPFVLVLALGAVAAALLIGGVACIAAGIGLCTGSVAVGLLTVGVGCIMIAVGVACATLLIWIAGKLIPKLLRKFTDFCNNLLNRKNKGGAEV